MVRVYNAEILIRQYTEVNVFLFLSCSCRFLVMGLKLSGALQVEISFCKECSVCVCVCV